LARVRTLFEVHRNDDWGSPEAVAHAAERLEHDAVADRNDDWGSPEAVGSTKLSRSSSSLGSRSAFRLRPPPDRRTRPAPGEPPSSNSRRPRTIVEYEIPVARATIAMPPYPMARASVAAQMRRLRSVKVGARASYLRWIVSASILQQIGSQGKNAQLFPDAPLATLPRHEKSQPEASS